jgi:hypothetical protein
MEQCIGKATEAVKGAEATIQEAKGITFFLG